MQRAIEPGVFRELIVRPALIAIGLWSEAAEILVTGTALQESGLRFLHQIKGPALGFFQMEPATHDDAWKNFIRSALLVRVDALIADGVARASTPDAFHMVGNAYYAAAMCRIHYARAPQPLPSDEADLAAFGAYWKAHYNTALGDGSAAEWVVSYRAAFPAASPNPGASA